MSGKHRTDGSTVGLPRAEAAAQEHARTAQRLDKLRRIAVRPLCAASFIAGASWIVQAWVSPVSVLAVLSTLLSPVSLAVAVVLTAVSSKHRPRREVRADWVIIGAALACAVFALARLARHMADL